MTAPTTRCKTGRWQFLTRESAVAARAALRSTGRIYACHLCGTFHWAQPRAYGRPHTNGGRN